MKVNKIKPFWNERWIAVPTTFPTKTCNYQISDHGRMKSVDKLTGNENLLKGSRGPYGFVKLNLRLKDNKRQSFYLHRLIADNFIEKVDMDKKFLIHKDNDKENNFYPNIQWVNQEELTAHQIKHGVFLPENRKAGSNRKLTEAKVRLLKKWIKEGKTKKKILAKNFGVTVTQVNRIAKGENWAHVKAL